MKQLLTLSPAEQRRLEKLAQDAGRTPQAMMKFVLRDGFEFCEWEVRASLAADEEIRRHGTISHKEVQRQARAIIAAAHAQRRRKAA